MIINFVSLSAWPTTPTLANKRKRSQFSSSWSNTVGLLESELNAIQASNIVLQADCDRDQIRIDGQLRATAKLRGPGVILSFDSKKGACSFPCDKFTDWQSNVRAIALSLQALRAVDRYGVTKSNEQYRGWNALPDLRNDRPSKSVFAAEWIVQEYLRNIGQDPGLTVENVLRRPLMRDLYTRALKKRFHPDSPHGDAVLFKQLLDHISELESAS